MGLVGHEPLLPDPFVGRRDEKAITRRMAEIRRRVAGLLEEGWGPGAVEEVGAGHEAETRRMGPPKGRRTKLYVDRDKGEPVVPRGTEPDDQEDEDPPDPGEARTPSRPPS